MYILYSKYIIFVVYNCIIYDIVKTSERRSIEVDSVDDQIWWDSLTKHKRM